MQTWQPQVSQAPGPGWPSMFPVRTVVSAVSAPENRNPDGLSSVNAVAEAP